MAFKKTVEIINVSAASEVKTGKTPYKVIEVAFKCDGKVEGKKLVSFANEQIFALAQTFKQGDLLDVALEKDKNGYWQWIEAVKSGSQESAAPSVEYNPAPTTKPAVSGRVTGSNYETAEERKVKQRNITRQFSINASLEYLALSKAKDLGLDAVLEIAKRFENHVYSTDPIQDLVDMAFDIPI